MKKCSLFAILLFTTICKADVNADAQAALALSNANAVKLQQLEADVIQLKADVAKLKNEPVKVLNTSEKKWIRGSVPGMVGEHWVEEGSPFAVGVQQQQTMFETIPQENRRFRQLLFRTPLMTGGVCVGPNCPR